MDQWYPRQHHHHKDQVIDPATGESWAPEGGGLTEEEVQDLIGTPYLVHRLMAQLGNANTEMPVNTTSYAQPGQTDFYHDWDLFPFTHFRLSCFGDANVAGQTVSFQLVEVATTTPVSAAGNDLVVSNGITSWTSGWIAVATPLTGQKYMSVFTKGSTSTVDFRGRWFDIEFKIEAA
jgi:hypothetical protein